LHAGWLSYIMREVQPSTSSSGPATRGHARHAALSAAAAGDPSEAGSTVDFGQLALLPAASTLALNGETNAQRELMMDGHAANVRGDTVVALKKFKECFAKSERLEARISAANMCLKLGQNSPSLPIKTAPAKLAKAKTKLAEISEKRRAANGTIDSADALRVVEEALGEMEKVMGRRLTENALAKMEKNLLEGLTQDRSTEITRAETEVLKTLDRSTELARKAADKRFGPDAPKWNGPLTEKAFAIALNASLRAVEPELLENEKKAAQHAGAFLLARERFAAKDDVYPKALVASIMGEGLRAAGALPEEVAKGEMAALIRFEQLKPFVGIADYDESVAGPAGKELKDAIPEAHFICLSRDEMEATMQDVIGSAGDLFLKEAITEYQSMLRQVTEAKTPPGNVDEKAWQRSREKMMALLQRKYREAIAEAHTRTEERRRHAASGSMTTGGVAASAAASGAVASAPRIRHRCAEALHLAPLLASELECRQERRRLDHRPTQRRSEQPWLPEWRRERGRGPQGGERNAHCDGEARRQCACDGLVGDSLQQEGQGVRSLRHPRVWRLEGADGGGQAGRGVQGGDGEHR